MLDIKLLLNEVRGLPSLVCSDSVLLVNVIWGLLLLLLGIFCEKSIRMGKMVNIFVSQKNDKKMIKNFLGGCGI